MTNGENEASPGQSGNCQAEMLKSELPLASILFLFYIPNTVLAEGRHLEASWWRSRPEAALEMRRQTFGGGSRETAIGWCGARARTFAGFAPGRRRGSARRHYGLLPEAG